jgi:enoyl-CoA hydratase
VVRAEVADGVATITLDEPARRNPMSERMGEELAAALAAVEAREDARVVVLAGAGASFSAGGDLALIEAKTRETPEARRRGMLAYYERYLAVLRCPLPTIAAVHGHAVGGGLALALACDLRYAALDAQLGVNFARLGLHPGMASTLTLPRAVGPARALELFYTGRSVSGREAEALGLVNRAVPAAELMATVREVAATIAGNAPLVVRMTKRAVWQGLEGAVRAALDYEAFCQAITYGTADLQEGLRAGRERRAPRFTGR